MLKYLDCKIARLINLHAFQYISSVKKIKHVISENSVVMKINCTVEIWQI